MESVWGRGELRLWEWYDVGWGVMMVREWEIVRNGVVIESWVDVNVGFYCGRGFGG